MFSHYELTVATAGQHRERLIDSASRHRLVFGRRSRATAERPLADVVALRTSAEHGAAPARRVA